MKQLQQVRWMLALAAPVVLGLASCSKDTAYDNLFEKDGVDLTMQLNAGLQLPLGSTENIKLTELLDPNKIDVLELTADGAYKIVKGGEISSTTIKVNTTSATANPTIEGQTFGFEAESLPANFEAMLNSLPADVVNGYLGKHISEIPGVSANLGIKAQCKALNFEHNTHFDLEATGVDTQLKSLKHIDFAERVPLHITLNVSDMPGTASEYVLTVNTLEISLPDYLLVEDEAGTKLDATHLVNLPTGGNKPAGTGNLSLDLKYYITGMDFGDTPLTNNNGTISRPGEVKIKGQAITDREFPIGTNEIVLDRNAENKFYAKIEKKVTVNPVLEPMNFEIAKVVGSFDVAPEAINTTVDLNITDDFLRNDVNITLADPAINLDLNCNTTVDVLADITLVPVRNGQELTPVSFQTVTLQNGKNVHNIVLSKENVKSGDIRTLLNPMPDQLKIHADVRTDATKQYTLVLGQDINVSGKYDLDATLSFQTIDINYHVKAENVFGSTKSDVDDIAKKLPQGVEKAKLTMTITNAVPVKLNLTVDALGWDGNPVLNNVQVSEISVNPGTIANPTVTNIVADVTIKDLAKVKDLDVVIKGHGENEEFNSNQYVKLQNLVLTVPGVTLNFND